MHFFNLPAAGSRSTRNSLCYAEPIKFKSMNDLSLSPLVLHKGCHLCPTALRANKRVYREANEMLYTRNRVEVIDLVPTERYVHGLSKS